jgi:RNA polymerase sigma-70 factor (family 1)
LGRKIHSDIEAFELLQQGIEAGLKYYFDQLEIRLIYFCNRIINDEQASEEIVSESFVKLWNSRHIPRLPSGVKPYLYKIVSNAAIDFLRLKKKEKTMLSDLCHLVEITDEKLRSFEISAETHALIYASIQSLPSRCGLVFRKFYIEQKTLPQIANELKVSVNTVRNQKARALAILREKWTTFLALVVFLHDTFINLF